LKPQLTDEVKVHYEGKLPDGQVFDSSYERGAPAAMPLRGLIPGWQEALQLMRPGDEWILYVPSNLGYGDQGAGQIPPGAPLIFRIELIDVLPGPGRIQQG
jgi:peptidylprolyl isomerase/FKBP-type peptidyl-prolyl cis-trans isomerase FklB